MPLEAQLNGISIGEGDTSTSKQQHQQQELNDNRSSNLDKNDFVLTESDFERLYSTDLLPAQGSFRNTAQFLLRVVDIMLDYMNKQNDRSTKVLDFHQPHQLLEILDLQITDEPQTLAQLLSDCKETLKYQVKTGHPRYFNQLSSGLDSVSLAGEWLTAVANTNMFTYEIAPVFILMEHSILRRMRKIVGWEKGDGIMNPGGAISNMYAMMAARYKFFPESKQKGMRGAPPLVAFTSAHSHYSILGGGATMGIGTENVILVDVDNRGKMKPDDLEEKIKEAKREGKTPYFVNVTAGTTVYGAFDPINEIAVICKKYNVWMHVDAAWGGGLLLSKKHRTLLAGIEKADSVTWNAHKLMGALLQCSSLLLRHEGLLIECNCMCADYLFQQDKPYDVTYDTGDKVIQCGRHNDIFKLWLMWRGKGDSGYEQHIDKLMEMTQYFVQRLRAHEGYEFVVPEPELVNVCFWYVPPSLRGQPSSPERSEQLGRITAEMKGRMMREGTTMVGYQPLDDNPNFFRPIISNPAVTREDIDFLVNELDRLGQDL